MFFFRSKNNILCLLCGIAFIIHQIVSKCTRKTFQKDLNFEMFLRGMLILKFFSIFCSQSMNNLCLFFSSNTWMSYQPKKYLQWGSNIKKYELKNITRYFSALDKALSLLYRSCIIMHTKIINRLHKPAIRHSCVYV